MADEEEITHEEYTNMCVQPGCTGFKTIMVSKQGGYEFGRYESNCNKCGS